ncbi:FAD-binding oxidoreductase [Kribbella shirazensis]|nr:FAD-binding oxidoreductase [Kribbella shirazensis]
MGLESWWSKALGDIVLPANPDYAEASSTYIWTGSPAVVVRPRDTLGIAAALRHAVANDLVVSVRSGGHGEPGFGTNNGGLVIDLSLINRVQVLDAHHRVVRLGAGATWTDVARALHPHGLSISSGDTGTVGVGGLILGGGIGWMIRKYGLTIDTLLAATIVTADGTVLRVSATEYPDLFWAIRGGGGNFGVVVDFDLVAHPFSSVVGGTILYRMDDVPALMRRWWDGVQGAVDELSTAFCVMPALGGDPPMVMVACCYAGDDTEAALAAIDPLLRPRTVIGHDIALRPYFELLHDAVPPPPGIRIVSKNVLVPEMTERLFTVLGDIFGSGQGSGPFVLRHIGGEMSKLPAAATAFAHRDAEVMVLAKTSLPIESTDEQVSRALRHWEGIQPFGIGSYVNFHGTATADDIANSYPAATYRRLAEVKAVYDPSNLFDQNHNIKPA